MSIQGKFKLTALAIAMTLPAVVNATNITESTVTNGAGGANVNISAIDDVNISLDTNLGGVGSFNIDKAGQNLLTIDADWNGVGSSVFNGNSTVNGVLSTNAVDLGSSSSSSFLSGSPNTTQLPVQLRQAADGTNYYEIDDKLGNNADNDVNKPSTYILSNNNLQIFTNTANSTFVNGGTASNVTKGTTDVATVTKDLDDKNLTYAETVKKTDSIQADFAVTDATGSVISYPSVYVDQGRTYSLTNKSIDTGIIGTTASGSNIYGVDLKTEQGTYLSADNSLISGSSNQATLTSDALLVKSTESGVTNTTEIKADGITINGNSVATKVDVDNGDAATLASANGYTDTTAQALRDEAATESARVNQAIANGDAATLASANGYTDAAEGRLNQAIANGDAATLDSANAYTDAAEGRLNQAIANGDAATLASANAYTDAAEGRLNQAIVDGDAATLASANAYTDAAEGRLNQAITDGDAATLASANAHTDTTAQALRNEAATESARVNQAIADGDAATLASANNHTDATAQALRNEVATEAARVDQAIASGDAATLASANTHTDATAQTLRNEAATESARVDQAIANGDASTLAAANTNIAASEGRLNQAITDGDAATLASANAFTNTAVSNITASTNAYTDTKATETLASANAYTDAQVSGVNTRVNQLNKRIDDVEKTSYRGIAIALAAQQQIPNIGAGQVAVFGGVGHYEGESAAALGLASVLNDGRTAFSAALGFAGGNEVGGRVGVSYVFGGK
ncbi:YadA family autotransporter adhesin [Acinetobacter cumulans]|nr:YadA-like family protein [Acinetobacter cumulans]